MTIAERDYPVAGPRPAARAAPANSKCGKRKINIANSFALLSDVRVWARRVVIAARAGGLWAPGGPRGGWRAAGGGPRPRGAACSGWRPALGGGDPAGTGQRSRPFRRRWIDKTGRWLCCPGEQINGWPGGLLESLILRLAGQGIPC